MDPVTGLTRRQQIVLAAIVPLGIAASTVATTVSTTVEAPCPNQPFECAEIQPGEPVVLGLLVGSEETLSWPLRVAADRATAGVMIEGHAVTVDVRTPGCSAEDSSEDARELVSDPPDEPPAVAVLATHCSLNEAPIAQILSDTGTTLVSLNPPGPIPTDPRYHVRAPEPDFAADASGLQAVGAASHLRELLVSHLTEILERVIAAVESVAIRDGERLLVPMTFMRDALVEAGFAREWEWLRPGSTGA